MKILTLIGGMVLLAVIVAGVAGMFLYFASAHARRSINKTLREWSR